MEHAFVADRISDTENATERPFGTRVFCKSMVHGRLLTNPGDWISGEGKCSDR